MCADSDGTLGPGVFIPLKTTLETRNEEAVTHVYVTAVQTKQASSTLNLIRKIVPGDGGLDLQHLRRFAKIADVPAHVRSASSGAAAPSSSEQQRPPKELFLILGPINAIPRADLEDALAGAIGDSPVFSVPVPLLAPTSQEQALVWTTKYWPTVYKKSNPFGPHPSIVSRAEDELRGDVERWLDLAAEAARQSKSTGSGEAVGVVIVERKGGIARPVAVAGDARWLDWPSHGLGNATAHATLRAIAMVAAGLKARDEEKEAGGSSTACRAAGKENEVNMTGLRSAQKPSQEECNSPLVMSSGALDVVDPALEDRIAIPEKSIPLEPKTAHSSEEINIFRDGPLLAIEQEHFDASENQDGYLCHGLEIYCTHEPCVMCSMAIVHSRFGRVVFERPMPATGGLCADGRLGHGLFWRKELNWTLLAWQYSRLEDNIKSTLLGAHVHV